VWRPVEDTDGLCPDCRNKLVICPGRFGSCLTCSSFPECSYRRSVVNKTGALCPLCNGDLVERKTKQKKRIFYGCANYPTCTFASWEQPIADLCPNCGGLMVIPKPGQEPVCYNEVIVPQRAAEAKPTQNGEKKPVRTTTTRKKAVRVKGTEEEVYDVLAPKTTTRRATTTRTKAASNGSTTRTRTTARAKTSRTATKSTTMRKAPARNTKTVK